MSHRITQIRALIFTIKANSYKDSGLVKEIEATLPAHYSSKLYLCSRCRDTGEYIERDVNGEDDNHRICSCVGDSLATKYERAEKNYGSAVSAAADAEICLNRVRDEVNRAIAQKYPQLAFAGQDRFEEFLDTGKIADLENAGEPILIELMHRN